ncbi:MAG TPA: LamG domain-containing protein [Candidatus Paceibacterota bacterium]|nr:LamG domain-containing protein [Candidatus Paceibacterota bacterium]
MKIYGKIFFVLGALFFTAMPSSVSAVKIITQPTNQLGVTAYWSFDNSTVSGTAVSDLSGNGHTLTLINGASITGGTSGQALTLDGTNQYAWGLIGTLPTSVSLSMWVKANDVVTEQSILTEEGDGAPSSGYHFTLVGILNGRFYAGFWDIGDIASSPINAGQWYNVVLYYDGVAHTQSLYLDGVLQGTQSGTWSPPSNIYFLAGYQQQSCSFTSASGHCGDLAHYFNGQIDELKGYNRALTSSDISSLQSARSHVGVSNTGLSRGLVDYWPLDGATTNWTTNKTNDIVGGSTATLNSISTTTAPVAGKIGQALQMRAANQYISATAAAPATTYSVSAWVRYQGATPISSIRVAVSYGNAGAGSTLWMGYASDGKLAISNSSFDIKSATVSNSTTWHHLVATVTGGVLSAYMDGALVNTTSMSSRGSNTLIIGDYTGSIGSFAFPGVVDDVRVYNRALSATEVSQLYQQGNVGTNVAHSPAPTTNAGSTNMGLVGYWTFDGSQTSWLTNTTRDSSGQGNTATMVSLGTTTSPVAGKIGQALHFNGNAQYVSASGSYPTGTNPRTLCAWAKSDDTTFEGNADHVVNYGTAATGQAFGFMIHTGNQWRFYGHGVDFDTNVSVDTKWHYHCVTYDGATVIYYIDGVNVASAARTLSTTAGNMTFAQRPDLGATNEFNGSIDDVRVYNRALSASEVNQLYLLGAPATQTPPPAENPAA